MANPKLIDKLFGYLPPESRRLLDQLLALSGRANTATYLVGGPLRDLLLGRPSLDLDIAVEGDAISLARYLAEVAGARVVQHPAFLTATVKLDSFVLDLAAARSETYARPGALPAVRPARISEDLLRRDFTINAMALRLTEPSRGELLDPADGRSDLTSGLIRALHKRSFRDDATRILRAARYETRFGFRIEKNTLEWLRTDVGYLATISGSRLRRELLRIFAEAQPERVLLHLSGLGALQTIHPELSFDERDVRAFATLRRLAPGGLPAAYWPLLAWDVRESRAAALSDRLTLTKAQSDAVGAMPHLRHFQDAIGRPNLQRNDLAQTLASLPVASIWALTAATEFEVIRDRCLDFLMRARFVRPLLRGDDILALGVPPGPPVGEVLRRLKAAKLDGEVISRKDEVQFVRTLLSAAPRHD